MDSIELEILWSNLIGIVTERAKALQRIAFSPVVREAGDLACALFDQRGRMVAQANTGTPGHINSLAIAIFSSPTIRGCRPGTSLTSPF
jgi:N-methylhydantoinase B